MKVAGLFAVLVLMAPSWVTASLLAPAPPETTTRSDTVHVVPPTGERESDRASILAALERVRPGGTVQFAPGTYHVGEVIPLETPRVTLLGHPDGTTLRGCDPAEYEELQGEAVRAIASGEPDAAGVLHRQCGMFALTGGHVTVRDLTFEYSRLGLLLGCCHADEVLRPSPGGYRIEGNTFRNSGNSIRAILAAAESTVIRGNRFINTFHALSATASRLHVLDNEISMPEPGRVPGTGHPGFAIGITALPPDRIVAGANVCEQNIIAGNRIDGHPDGILLSARQPGASCRENVVRENTIQVRRVRFPVPWLYADLIPLTSPEDSTFVGVPLALSASTAGSDSADDQRAPVRVENNRVENNRIIGAEGLGIAISHASGNRVANNTLTGIERREPFPGNRVSWLSTEWREANGSGIWVSPGSDDNEIVGNTFRDIAVWAVVLEGNRNRVDLRSASDSVRDLGTGNDVITTASAGAGEPSYWRPLASPNWARVSGLSRSPAGTLFAATTAGLFASEDLGLSWHLRGSANRSLGPPLVTLEGALLAGSYRQGILRSTDGGRCWTSVGLERNIYAGDLVRDRRGRIYAKARGAVGDEPTGVFRSDDDGRTWTASGLVGAAVYDLSIPRSGVLFAGTREGLFRSEDGGDSWLPAGELPSGAPVSAVVAFEGDLFASMGDPLWDIPRGGVDRSRDGGDTWEPTEGLPAGAAVRTLVVHEGTLFAAVGDLNHDDGTGLYRLDSAGRFRPSGLDDVWILSLLSTPDGLFTGAYGPGVFHSEDGRSWVRRSEGLRNWEVPALAAGTNGTLYALTQVMDLFRSGDRGRSWTSTPRPEGSAVPSPWSMIVSPGGRLLLAAKGGILVSDDGGGSWEHRTIPEEDDPVFALSAGPGGELFAVVRRKAAYLSPDEGRSWRRLDLPATPVQALFSSPSGTRIVMTAEGFLRSSGDGSWEKVAGEHVWAFTACGAALIAGTYARGLLRSTDDGRTWSPVTEELRARSQQSGYLSFTALACLPDGGVLAGTFWDGVFYSPDAGETWKDATAGLPAESVQDFAVSPDGRVFVSTPVGIFVNVALPDE